MGLNNNGWVPDLTLWVASLVIQNKKNLYFLQIYRKVDLKQGKLSYNSRGFGEFVFRPEGYMRKNQILKDKEKN